MARKIDYANLNSDDLQYVADRQWLIAEGDYQGFETSKSVAAWREDGTVPEPAESDESDEGAGEAGEDEGIEYKDATVADLRAELERRELPTEGKKAELVARLEAHDLEHEDDEIEEEEIPEDEEPES